MDKTTRTVYGSPFIRVHINPGIDTIQFCDYSAKEFVEFEDLSFNEINRAILAYVRDLKHQKDEGYKCKWLKELAEAAQESIDGISKYHDF